MINLASLPISHRSGPSGLSSPLVLVRWITTALEAAVKTARNAIKVPKTQASAGLKALGTLYSSEMVVVLLEDGILIKADDVLLALLGGN
jgi:hypothetical protein